MTLSAFNGEQSVRDAALGNLEKWAEQQNLTAGSFYWDGSKASVAAALIESNDPEEWERRLGLARWLAYVLDVASSNLGPVRAVSESSTLLKSVPLGIDTVAMGSPFVCALLKEFESSVAEVPELAQSLAEVLELHRRIQANQDVAPSEWRRVRQTAGKVTDALAPAPDAGTKADGAQARIRTAGLAIEAAGWDPRKSGTSTSDVLRQWLNLEGLNSDTEFGWTKEDDALIRRMLGEMHTKFLVGHPEEKRDVFGLLREHHPEIEARLLAYTRHGQAFLAVCAERAFKMLQRLLTSLT